MNVERNIKLLTMKLGRMGHDVSVTKEQRYSREYDSVYSRYKITFWQKGKKIDKKTNKEKEVSIPDTHEFNNGIELLKYMVVRSNERAT